MNWSDSHSVACPPLPDATETVPSASRSAQSVDSSGNSSDRLIEDIAQAGIDCVSIRTWKVSPDGKTLVLTENRGPEVPFDGLGLQVPIDRSELGQVVRTGEPYVVRRISESAPIDVQQWARAHGACSFVAVPAIRKSGKGVLALFTGTMLQQGHLDALMQIARNAPDAAAPTESARIASEDLLPSLIQCLPSAVITLDEQGLVTRWNAAAQTLFGWSEAEVRGKPLPFVPPDRAHEFSNDLAQTLMPGRVLRSRTVCRRANGSACHVHRSASLLSSQQGQTLGRVEVLVDESRSVRTGRCLEVQAQATRIITGCRTVDEAAPLLLAVVGEWLDAEAAEFWTVDERQGVLVRSGIWAASAGQRDRLAASELRIPIPSAAWPANTLQRGELIFWEDVDTPAATVLSPARKTLHVPVPGLAIPVGSRSAPCAVITCLGGGISKPDDLAKQTLGAVADAAGQFIARVRTEFALAEAETNLRQTQKMDAVGLLAGGVAHDFNNLLTIILAYSEMGLTEVDEDNPLHELFAEVHGAGERAAAMTRQLLAVSRRQPTRVQSVDLNRLVSDMERMLQRLIGANISLTRQCAEGLANVQADLNQMEQVVLNLVVNARDAMPEGGTITVSTRNVTLRAADVAGQDVRAGEYVELAVSDTGCGMDEATQARIFEPFFTTKEVGRGTGMGLSTVFGIVKQAGGFIRVDSTLNQGTTFSILLPESRDVLVARSIDGETAGDPTGTERILIVENNAPVRKLVRKLLELRGYTVEEAIHGGEAFEMLSQKHPRFDLVLSDVQMPVMDGLTLARKVRDLPGAPTVLLMSANADLSGDAAPGADWQFLPKPFTSETLARRVRTALDAHTAPGQ